MSYTQEEVVNMLKNITKATAETRGTFENRFDNYDKELAELKAQNEVLETAMARRQSGGDPAALRPQLTNGRFAVDVQGRKIPVLARGDKMAALYPRPSGEFSGWSIGEYVRANLGVKASVLERGPASVPVFIGAQIIDMVREKARIIQAGALTIPLPDGPTNLCRIVSDPTVSEHTEATDDITESAPVFEPAVLDPKTLAVLIPLSLEIVQDSPNLDAALQQSISAAFALKLDQLGIATILADATIPESESSEATDAWSGVLAATGSMLALNQGLPKACICGPGDFIARAGELASTAGSWLGAPPVLQNMLDLETTGMTDGFAILGNFELGFAIAVRQELRLEVIRWGKPGYGSHVLVAYARMGGYVLQPAHLYNQIDTVSL